MLTAFTLPKGVVTFVIVTTEEVRNQQKSLDTKHSHASNSNILQIHVAMFLFFFVGVGSGDPRFFFKVMRQNEESVFFFSLSWRRRPLLCLV